jgi:hypothetical protein
MQARVVVFPVKGRAWCFARPAQAAAVAAGGGGGDGGGALPPPTLRDLWRGITTKGRTAPEKAESVVDFVADKVLARTPTRAGSAPVVACIWALAGFSDGLLRCADEPGVDRVWERAGGVDEEPDPQVSCSGV